MMTKDLFSFTDGLNRPSTGEERRSDIRRPMATAARKLY